MSFPILPGVAPFCQGKWDEQANKFVPTSSMEVIQCCLNSCKYHPQFCFNLCDSTYKDKPHMNKICYQQCNELAVDCEDSCFSIPSKGMNIIRTCAEESNCGKQPIFNIDCLQENRDKIGQCCREACVGDQSLDCDGRCEDLHALLVQGNTTSVKSIPVHKETKSEFNTKQNHTVAWILLILVILILIGVITLI